MIQMILFVGLFAISFIIYRWIIKYLALRKALSHIPNKFSPFIGWKLMHLPREDRFKWFLDLCFKIDNGMILIWMGTKPILTIRKPEQIEIILSSNKFITKSSTYNSLKPWLGNGLVTSTGEIWFKHRRLLTPAFHFNVLENYVKIMHKKIEILKNSIEAQVKVNQKVPINILDLLTKYALDIICETAMGVNVDVQRNLNNTYIKALNKFSQSNSERFLRPWLISDFVFYCTKFGKESLNAIKKMHNFTQKVIEQRQVERKNNIFTRNNVDEETYEYERKRKAFLDLLLDHYESTENSLTIKEIREEVETFMFAVNIFNMNIFRYFKKMLKFIFHIFIKGHDTTALSISWSLFALGNAPEVQSKLRDEINDIFQNNYEKPTIKQLGQLKYMDRVIKEILRVYPIVPAISRKLEKDTLIDNHVIPKGTDIRIEIYQLHHDPATWNLPETFNPDRFLPENSNGRHTYAFIPFSAGPRNCIGQKFALLEIKMALVLIIGTWHVSTILKPHELNFIHEITLRPCDEKIELYLTPINNI